MKQIIMGNTGIAVSELCFGALPMGPLQKNMDDDEAAEVLAHALRGGINFIDTAQVYKTYKPIRLALEKTGLKPVIASKSNLPDYSGMEDAVYEALESLGVEVIDIFHLHSARPGPEVFKDRKEALKALCDLKEKGIIRATGISCHSAETLSAAADVKEIDVVFPLINYAGMGIIGTLEAMKTAVARCTGAGKGIYLMKVLAGGNLAENYGRALQFVRSLGSYPISLGMVSKKEVDYNIAYFNSQAPESIPDPTFRDFNKRFHVVKKVCIACGKCIETCASSAIEFVDDKAYIIPDKCIMCGYCVGSCPAMAIRSV